MADRIAEIWGSRTPHAAGSEWPVRVDQFLEEGLPEAAGRAPSRRPWAAADRRPFLRRRLI
jgi:hypothetical protein